jgi:hypothetical protein
VIVKTHTEGSAQLSMICQAVYVVLRRRFMLGLCSLPDAARQALEERLLGFVVSSHAVLALQVAVPHLLPDHQRFCGNATEPNSRAN